jgi:hypothetical protein
MKGNIMKRPNDLTIKLSSDQPRYVSDGSVCYTMTPVGHALYILGDMWEMSLEEVVAKIASAAITEEERFIVDGKYVKPHRRVVPTAADYE